MIYVEVGYQQFATARPLQAEVDAMDAFLKLQERCEKTQGIHDLAWLIDRFIILLSIWKKAETESFSVIKVK